MDLVVSLREWKKKAEIGEDEGKLINPMSSLGVKEVYSTTVKRNTVCEGMSSFSTILSIQGGVSEFECMFEHVSFSEEGNFLCFSPFGCMNSTTTFQFYK